MTASRKPLVLRSVPCLPDALLPRLMKKLTVIGMMGHTQGVRIATKPPKRPNKNMVQREKVSAEASVAGWAGEISSGLVGMLVMVVLLVSLVVLVLLVKLVSLVILVVLVVLVSLAPSPLKEKSTLVGGRQLWSLQAPYSKYPSTE